MKQKFIDAYMDVAARFADLSTARRKKVGAIVVKDDRIISIGYNGMPPGWTNDCEIKTYCEDGDWSEQVSKTSNQWRRYKLTTKPEVIHAEANAIAKLAKGNESGDGSTMFLTCSPCIDCAKQIFTAGIRKVYYRDSYRNDDGVVFLQQCGVEVDKYSK
jgi:dCMP deaminase